MTNRDEIKLISKQRSLERKLRAFSKMSAELVEKRDHMITSMSPMPYIDLIGMQEEIDEIETSIGVDLDDLYHVMVEIDRTKGDM